MDLAAPPDLTPSELRVLLAIVEIGSIAEALGIGAATVKTHLHRLFAKTAGLHDGEPDAQLAGSELVELGDHLG